MKQYINTSNYYLGVLTTVIDDTSETGTFEVDSVENDHVTLPVKGFYWLDVDFQTSGEREIFRITGRVGNTLTYDKRISPTGKFRHEEGSVVGLRDFAELFNSLSSNTDNFGQIEQVDNVTVKVFGGNVFVQGGLNRQVLTKNVLISPNNSVQYLHFDSSADSGNEFVLKNDQDPYLFLLASITTDTSSITGIEDLRGVFIGANLGFLRLDGSTPMEGDLDMHGHKILNVDSISGNPIVEGATGNTIAGFNNTKHLVSLNPDTYPNLTELSYLKGVTSSVQQQLDDSGDIRYDDFSFGSYSGNNTYTISDLSTNISCDSDITLNAGADLKEGQQYIVRVYNNSPLTRNIIFGTGIDSDSPYLGLAPQRTTTINLLALDSSHLEAHALSYVTSVNGQIGDVIIDLNAVLDQGGQSGVGNLVRDTNLWSLEPGTYQIGENEDLGEGYPVKLYYNSTGYLEALYGSTVSIQYNNGNNYTILSGMFIEYGYADQFSGTYRKIWLHQNEPVTLTYAANLDVDLDQSLNYYLYLTGDCILTFGEEYGHSAFTPGCVYQIIVEQDTVGGHTLTLSGTRAYADGYTQDTTANSISKLILDYDSESGIHFASISKYNLQAPL